jgi:DNA-3-methyladenine glycosylase II
MKFILEPIPPFDFELTAGFFSYDDPEIRIFENGIFQQVIPLENKLAVVKISSDGTAERPKLLIELESDTPFSPGDKSRASNIIISMFNLNIDLNEFYSQIKNDKILSTVVKKLRGLKGPNNTTIFEGMVCSIIEQQISLNVAFSVQKKVTKKFGDKIDLIGKTYYSFPTPTNFIKKPIEDFRACGLSQRKGEYIRGLSELIVDDQLDLTKFKDYSNPNEVINELTKIRGIGVWTVELTMLRSMGRFDVVPADDLGLKRYISRLYFKGEKITGDMVRQTLDKYGRWKGLVAYYFLEADRLGFKVK